MDLLRERGSRADYYDPFVPELPATREHPDLVGQRSIDWSPEALKGYDAALLCTDHDQVDYAELMAHSRLVVDCRNATRFVENSRERIVKA